MESTFKLRILKTDIQEMDLSTVMDTITQPSVEDRVFNRSPLENYNSMKVPEFMNTGKAGTALAIQGVGAGAGLYIGGKILGAGMNSNKSRYYRNIQESKEHSTSPASSPSFKGSPIKSPDKPTTSSVGTTEPKNTSIETNPDQSYQMETKDTNFMSQVMADDINKKNRNETINDATKQQNRLNNFAKRILS